MTLYYVVISMYMTLYYIVYSIILLKCMI